MRWQEGWKGMGGRAASGRFLLKIENRQKSATVGLGGGGCFFVFMRLVGSPTLPYLTFVVGTGSCWNVYMSNIMRQAGTRWRKDGNL